MLPNAGKRIDQDIIFSAFIPHLHIYFEINVAWYFPCIITYNYDVQFDDRLTNLIATLQFASEKFKSSYRFKPIFSRTVFTDVH